LDKLNRRLALRFRGKREEEGMHGYLRGGDFPKAPSHTGREA